MRVNRSNKSDAQRRVEMDLAASLRVPPAIEEYFADRLEDRPDGKRWEQPIVMATFVPGDGWVSAAAALTRATRSALERLRDAGVTGVSLLVPGSNRPAADFDLESVLYDGPRRGRG